MADFEAQDEDELQDLEDDAAAHDMPPKKASTSGTTTKTRARKSKSPKKTDSAVEDLEKGVEAATLSDDAVHDWLPTYVFPFRGGERSRAGSKDIIHYHFQVVNIPKDHLISSKVLPGGMQFEVQFGCPEWFFEEGFLEKILHPAYDPNHARVITSHASVVQKVRKTKGTHAKMVVGPPQIINLPFRCIEGDVTPYWGQWQTNGMPQFADEHGVFHTQFQLTVSFSLTSVHDNLHRATAPQHAFFGYAAGEAPPPPPPPRAPPAPHAPAP